MKLINKYSVRFGSTTSCGCAKKGAQPKLTSRALARNPGDAGLDLLYSNLRHNARKRGIEFMLSKEILREVSSQKCSYCGRPPYKISAVNNRKWGLNSTRDHGAFKHSPIDRVDSTLGYIEGNITACCKKCNYAKNVMSVHEFKLHIIEMYNHLELSKYIEDNK